MKIFTDVNNHQIEFDFKENNGGFTIVKGNTDLNYDLAHLGGDRYSLIHNDQSFLLHFSARDGHVLVCCDGQEYVVAVETEREQRIRDMASGREDEQKDVVLKAPIPGLVTAVQAEVGRIVKKDEPVLILEAMKMENIIKAPCSCLVEDIFIKTGQNVEQGMPLIKLKSSSSS